MNDQSRRAPPVELSAGQADALRFLLESELRMALGAAREAGASRAAIDATIAESSRLLGGSADDRQNLFDQGGDGDPVPEQG
jgi:hypothetical protein